MSYILARKPELVQAVVQKYPDFDGSKAAAYPKVYDEFTSTKPGTAGAALNAGGTALQHLKELRDLNTVQSHNPPVRTTPRTKTRLTPLLPSWRSSMAMRRFRQLRRSKTR